MSRAYAVSVIDSEGRDSFHVIEDADNERTERHAQSLAIWKHRCAYPLDAQRFTCSATLRTL